MDKQKILVIIPARYASTRFPGKPLARLGGREMILRVCDRVKESGLRLAVATDDQRIFECVEQAGYLAVMTNADCPSGTDRVCEASTKVGGDIEVIVNVQGDEPFIDASQLEEIVKCFDDSSTDIATLARPYPSDGSYKGLEDSNLVKLVISEEQQALYFSRQPIPFLRGVEKEEWPKRHKYLTHIGIYAYKSNILPKLASLPRSPLEISESLEQLRWLQAGFKIKVGFSDAPTIGIDTPADLEAAEIYLRSQKK